jgi:hypothetical protein
MRNRARPLLAALALTGSIIVLAAVAGPAVGDSLPTAAFAIGDGNAVLNAPVTFWGSQWWKDNQVSTGAGPASFKGYAVTVDPTACTFTTAPGNSAPPPDGPLASVITVLVTSSVTKSGPTISGKITEFALVATNDGYDSNPGHDGTGTVIGFIPCGSHGGDGGGVN